MARRARWILFDAVGTLIYPDPPVAAAYLAVGRRFGSHLAEEEVRGRFTGAVARFHTRGEPTSEDLEQARWRQIVSAVFHEQPENGEAIFAELWRHFADPAHWRLFDDVSATLATLRECGYRLGIASNFDHRLLKVADAYPALADIENVFVSSDVGFTKPNPRFFEVVQQRLAASADEIVLVGDDWLQDIEGGRAAGWRAIYLDRKAATSSGDTMNTLADMLKLDL
jgi:putative hydrolase of the HAD superfamily